MERVLESSQTTVDLYRPHEIDSSTIMPYLWGDIPFNQSNLKFSSYLNLGLLKPYFEYLQRNSQEVYVFSEEQRRELVGYPDDPEATSSKHPLQRRIRESLESFANIRSVGERSLVIYYDPEKSLIDATEVIHGEFGSTTAATYEVFQAGQIPLMEVHTHPHNELFSPLDYYRMIVNLFNEPYRMLRAAVVLCPDIQVMALATPQTSLISQSMFQELADNVSFDEAETLRENQLLARRDDVILAMGKRAKQLLEKGVEHLKELEDYYTRGLISEEEFSQLMDNDGQEMESQYKAYAGRCTVLANRIFEVLLGYQKHTTNRKLLAFARGVGIKLYSSTDFQHFRAFSA